jgi:imidazolonepropionase-like amidohydrolase
VLAKAREAMNARQAAFEAALRYRVPIAMGTDCEGQDLLPHGPNARELELFVRGGMTTHEAIIAGTSGAAKCIGLEREIGAVEPGRVADVIAVAGNPLADITELQRVQFVMKDGQVVRDLPAA